MKIEKRQIFSNKKHVVLQKNALLQQLRQNEIPLPLLNCFSLLKKNQKKSTPQKKKKKKKKKKKTRTQNLRFFF